MPDFEDFKYFEETLDVDVISDITDFHLLPFECRSFIALYSVLAPEDQAVVRNKIEELLENQRKNQSGDDKETAKTDREV